MSIQEIMNLGGSKISANVNFEDLKAFADYLIQKTKLKNLFWLRKKRLS